jgi:hypothetical protein
MVSPGHADTSAAVIASLPYRAGDADFRLAAQRRTGGRGVTYIRNAWGNAAAAVSPDRVQAIRRKRGTP